MLHPYLLMYGSSRVTKFCFETRIRSITEAEIIFAEGSELEAKESPRLRVGARRRGPRRKPRSAKGEAATEPAEAAAEPSKVAKSGATASTAAKAQSTEGQATISRREGDAAAEESRGSVQTFTNPMFADDAEGADAVEQVRTVWLQD